MKKGRDVNFLKNISLLQICKFLNKLHITEHIIHKYILPALYVNSIMKIMCTGE